jgi:hypothetical protein
MRSKAQRIAKPLTRDEVEEAAWNARADLGLRPFERVPVAHVLDLVLPHLFENYQFRVADRGSLGNAEAITHPVDPIITFDEKVHRELEQDRPRARMTGAHELGHLLMHTGQTFMAFMTKPDPRVDIERQADIFGAAFLMPECAFRQVKSISEAMRRFGVSRDAACCRARSLKMHWLIRGKAAPKQLKKKGYSKRRTPQ